MIRRRTTLEEALDEIESEKLEGVTAIVVNLEWWQQLPLGTQNDFRRRCTRRGVDLRADEALSRHFVELASDRHEPPLSTEQRV
jgi:hypothetical protein